MWWRKRCGEQAQRRQSRGCHELVVVPASSHRRLAPPPRSFPLALPTSQSRAHPRRQARPRCPQPSFLQLQPKCHPKQAQMEAMMSSANVPGGQLKEVEHTDEGPLPTVTPIVTLTQAGIHPACLLHETTGHLSLKAPSQTLHKAIQKQKTSRTGSRSSLILSFAHPRQTTNKHATTRKTHQKHKIKRKAGRISSE